MAASRFLVNLTRGPEDPDRVTVALVMANAALALEKEVVVLLSTEGVRAADRRVVASIAEPGFMPLQELVDTYLADGGQIWACTPCVKKRQLEDALIDGVRLVGAVAAIQWVSEDGVSFSF
jgi:predicted peroxiredoxin